MYKSTVRALRYTHFTPESHPALVSLIDYAAQRPGIDPRNYGSWATYREEANRVSRQWRRICRLLVAADFHRVTDEQIIEASQWIWSGRYHWDGHTWDYCTGQYFPVEYRAAIIAILNAALPTV